MEKPDEEANGAPDEEAMEEGPDADTIEEQLAKGEVPQIDLTAELKKMAEVRGDEWVPKTRLGRLVKTGTITSMSQALSSGLPLREPEIADILLPELADEVIDVNMVQRMTDSGRRVRFSITTVVGNRDGFVGVGMAKGREVGPTIRRSIDNAKLNLLEIRRGCGSWECGCRTAHTVPFEVVGKCASAEIRIKPAPRGVGLAVGEIARKVLGLAGVKDAWGFARGQTRTTVNSCKATFDALERISTMRMLPTQADRTPIVRGPSAGAAHTHIPAPEPPPEAAEAPSTAQETPPTAPVAGAGESS